MKESIIQLFNDGDELFKEAKKIFLNNQEAQSCATCDGCKALKMYLDAYMLFFNEHYKPTDNYHIVVRTLIRLDPEFEKFYSTIFDIKCFAEESKNEGDKFFLFDIEVNKAIHFLEEIRNYIAKKIHFDKQFLSEFLEHSFMGT